MAFDPNNPAGSGMVLTFDDEFNTNSISSDNAASGTLWSNHIWYEAANPNAGTVANGVLSLASGASLSSVNSSGAGFSQQYGYFEIDMKVPAGVGTWPAFWLMSQQHVVSGSNPASEIDIIEGQGSTSTGYYTTLHSNTGSGQDQFNPTTTYTGNLGDGSLSDGYHRFGVLWSPDSNLITYYFDGKAVATSTKYSTTDYSPDMVLIDNWVGDMIGSNYPNASTGQPPLLVDYVRVYQFAGQGATAALAQTVSPAAGQTDPTALAGAGGGALSAPSSGGTTGSSGSTTPPIGSNPLTLKVAGDMYNGDPLIAVTVDGKLVGTYDISAHHSLGQAQTITIGSFDPTVAHQIQIQFTNDAWDYTAGTDGHDRNVYVEQVGLNGVTVSGSQFTANTASLGQDSLDPNSAVMLAPGMASYTIAADPPSATPPSGTTTGSTGTGGTGTSTGGGTGGTTGSTGSTAGTGGTASTNPLVLKVAGDMYAGDPQIIVTVDGTQIGNYDISAHHSLGQVQTISVGNFDSTVAHQIQVNFYNDLWDGTSGADGHDRNAYVEQVSLNGITLSGQQFTSNTGASGFGSIDPQAAVMVGSGTATYAIAADPPPASGSSGGSTASTGSTGTTGTGTSGSGTTTTNPLVLKVAGDMYAGDPHIIVTVDGKQLGDYDVSAHHSLGQVQTITLGNFDPSVAHQIQVNFYNDLWDGSGGDGHDRNVYVEQVSLNGVTLSGQQFTSNNAAYGFDSIDPHAAVMVGSGTATYSIAAEPAATSGGTHLAGAAMAAAPSPAVAVSSGLALTVSGDMYNGDPQITVLVDGQQVGTYDISAHHSQGEVQTITIDGSFDPTVAHDVTVQFNNDDWDYTTPNADGHDRNAYVESVSLNGQVIGGEHFTANTASLGQDSLDPNAGVLLMNGSATYHAVAELTLAPSLMSGGGNVYTVNSPTLYAGQVTAFNPADDTLDLIPALKSAGYRGTDPIADHVVSLVAVGGDSTAVMIDPTGHDPNHGTTVVTLDHLLPQSVPAADLVWH